MSRPTKENPRIKWLGKTKKGLPVHMWCMTYFEYSERANAYTQKQEWSKEKPTGVSDANI